jgi:hypothetical protein
MPSLRIENHRLPGSVRGREDDPRQERHHDPNRVPKMRRVCRLFAVGVETKGARNMIVSPPKRKNFHDLMGREFGRVTVIGYAGIYKRKEIAMIEVRSQAQADAAVKNGETEIHVFANVTLIFGAGTPHVEAWGSSQPHVEAWESSQPHVEAWGSSQPHVEARGSSQPHVEAWAYAILAIRGRCKVTATAEVRIRIDGGDPEVSGGVVHRVPPITSPSAWCERYDIPVADGVAVLFKCLSESFSSHWGFDYTPGTTPVAKDWDGGKKECGGGLHFCPTPGHARGYQQGLRYVACPVALADMAVVPNPEYPDKIKAAGCCAPVWECDRDGKRIEVAEKSHA